MTNQRTGLQRLTVIDLPGNRPQRGVQFLNPTYGTDLRQLGGQFVVLQRIGWVLVFQLCDQQRQKTALQVSGITARQGAIPGGGFNACIARVIHGYSNRHMRLLYCPNVSVLSIKLFTVLSTSTFAW